MGNPETWKRAVEIFMEETRRAAPKCTGSHMTKAQLREAVLAHQAYLLAVDAKLQEIGWTLREYQDHKRSPQERRIEEQVMQSLWDN